MVQKTGRQCKGQNRDSEWKLQTLASGSISRRLHGTLTRYLLVVAGVGLHSNFVGRQQLVEGGARESYADMRCENAMSEMTAHLERIVEEATSALKASGGTVYLVDPEREEALRLAALTGVDKADLIPDIGISKGAGIAGMVMESKKPVTVSHYTQWHRAVPERRSLFNSAVEVPFLLEGKVIGVLGVFDTARDRQFEPNDVEALQTIANQALDIFKSHRQQHHEADHASTADIIESVTVPWNILAKEFHEHPDELHRISPRKFEELIAEIFRSYGWEVDLTARTRDGGYDIVAVRRDLPQSLKVLVEAKRNSPNRPVGVEVVRSLFGVKSMQAASQVILATSSYVSKDARREFSRVIPWELDFYERDKILEWCKQYGCCRLRGTLGDTTDLLIADADLELYSKPEGADTS